MNLSRIDLESFEESLSETTRSADYMRGFEDGEQTSQNSDFARRTASIESLSSALHDMNFGYTEARIQLLEKIRPILSQVADVILPSIAAETFASHLIDVIYREIDRTTTDTIKIAVSEDDVEHLSSELHEHADHVTFVGDPNLEAGQAILQNSETQTLIDLPALLLALQTALNGLAPIERTHSNG